MTRAPTPLQELAALESDLRALGGEVSIGFDVTDGDRTLSVSAGALTLPAETEARLLALAPYLIEAEIPEWEGGNGSSGSVRISGRDAPWLSADTRDTDDEEGWSFDRDIDTDLLEDVTWDDPSETPSP